MAKDTNNFPDDDPDDDPSFDSSVNGAIICAADFALQLRHKFLTVEHVLMMLMFSCRVGFAALEDAKTKHSIRDTLRNRLHEHAIQLRPSEPPELIYGRCLEAALHEAIVLAYPHQATVLDVLYAIFKQEETFASKVLRDFGLSNRKLKHAVRAQKRAAP